MKHIMTDDHIGVSLCNDDSLNGKDSSVSINCTGRDRRGIERTCTDVPAYLSRDREPLPEWLMSIRPGDPLDMEQVLKSRIVYYPGAGDDGQPIRTLNSAHYAHVYLYVDYGIDERTCRHIVTVTGAFKGYHLIDIRNIGVNEIIPDKWVPHCPLKPHRAFSHSDPYCLVSVFERDDAFGEEHGEKRFMLIQLFADGIETYDALFGNGRAKIDTLILQDHGFGGNYDRFGRSGLMNRMAENADVFPRYIFCEDHGNIWDGYEKIPCLAPEIGGMWSNRRYLFKRIDKEGIKKMSEHRAEYTGLFPNGLVIAEISGGRYIIDTGSPVSFSFSGEDGITINEESFDLVPPFIPKEQADGPACMDIEGFIGMDILSRTGLSLDRKNGRIVFDCIPPENGGSKIGISVTSMMGMKYIFTGQLGINGNNLNKVILDTGAGISYVAAQYLDEKDRTDEKYEDVNPEIGEIAGYYYSAELRIPENSDARTVKVGEMPFAYTMIADAIISPFLFGRDYLAFDFGGGTLYLG